MPITHAVKHARNISIETWGGRIDADDLADYWRVYPADPNVMSAGAPWLTCGTRTCPYILKGLLGRRQ
jgi:hypothetical protein